MLAVDPLSMIRPKRRIYGISAILLPFDSTGTIDWSVFRAHVLRTAESGLIPAVNMDTGYVNLIDVATRVEVLEQTRRILAGGPFVAGAFIADHPDSPFDRDRYVREMERVQSFGGTPTVFQSYGLTHQSDDAIVDSYLELGRHCDRYIGFELGTMFAPFGKIYALDVYRRLLAIPSCIGAKHSSLSRELEWQRLAIRDEMRPDFHVYTGNDLAIDMVMYGSDYLLGLSTFAPDLFAKRDAYWQAGDPAFYELNDILQYLGFLTFRAPVPAYKHSAAMFLHLRGWLTSDRTHPNSPERPASDRAILREIGNQLDIYMESGK